MTSIKPISDLRNYSAVLRDVAIGSHVYLNKNGYVRYAIIDSKEQEEYEKMKAEIRLISELEKGRKSGEEEGWLSEGEVRAIFVAKQNGK
ncbi:MAG: hypothetical protein RSC10_06305 [Longicatena sp.]